jgi:hypothetical protein
MSYLVCIPTAGTGSRLGELTKHLNKSLLPVGKKPGLSRIIDMFPKDTTFVIALGHQGHLVKAFLGLAYPQRKFLFSDVQPFEGPGSGLGHSLLCCRKYLQAPFIFCSCDTITTTPVPPPDENWMGFGEVEDISSYRTLSVSGGTIARICEKKEPGENLKAYIGLAGITDHKTFWQAMSDGSADAVLTGESHGMRALLDRGIKASSFAWYDTGNLAGLVRTRQAFLGDDDPNILDKPNEAIWFVDGTVIKFSADQDFIRKRVLRAKLLAGYCPAILHSARNMYQYAEEPGDILSRVVTLPLFTKLLDKAQAFWTKAQLTPKERTSFQKTCFQFYRDKTRERVAQFYAVTGHDDRAKPINSKPLPTLSSLLDRVDWNWLSQGLPGRFHGDFHFENILYNAGKDKFIFLDWRQDFGGLLEIGDIYYDLAKLLHGLIICHELIARDHYSVQWGKDGVTYTFERKKILIRCEEAFFAFLQDNGYDVKRVRTLTALIYLNIAALHHHPYRELLYCLGKDMLSDILK